LFINIYQWIKIPINYTTNCFESSLFAATNKTGMRYILGLFIFISLFFSSCHKEDDSPGTLIAKVYKETLTGDPAVNARMNLAISETNLNQGIFEIENVYADAQGIIEVNNLQPRTYYYEVIASDYHGSMYYAKGNVKIPAGDIIEITVVLTKQ
ncbi:MAG: hypothetical protein D6707_05155, partial [Bacteroidetes bacterium]